jgi:hypothetical protein
MADFIPMSGSVVAIEFAGPHYTCLGIGMAAGGNFVELTGNDPSELAQETQQRELSFGADSADAPFAPGLAYCDGKLYLAYTAHVVRPLQSVYVNHVYSKDPADPSSDWTEIAAPTIATRNSPCLASFPAEGSQGEDRLWHIYSSSDNSKVYRALFDPSRPTDGWYVDSNPLPFNLWGAPSCTVLSSPPRAARTLVVSGNDNNGAVGVALNDGKGWAWHPQLLPAAQGQIGVYADPTTPDCEPLVTWSDNGTVNYGHFHSDTDTLDFHQIDVAELQAEGGAFALVSDSAGPERIEFAWVCEGGLMGAVFPDGVVDGRPV